MTVGLGRWVAVGCVVAVGDAVGATAVAVTVAVGGAEVGVATGGVPVGVGVAVDVGPEVGGGGEVAVEVGTPVVPVGSLTTVAEAVATVSSVGAGVPGLIPEPSSSSLLSPKSQATATVMRSEVIAPSMKRLGRKPVRVVIIRWLADLDGHRLGE